MTVPVSEVFGPVTQGEGPFAGRRCSFLRLGLCNLSCEWCDTPYTWDARRFDLAAENPGRDVAAIVGPLLRHRTTLLVLSGGEPLIHQTNQTLLAALSHVPHEVHVETNGTIHPHHALADRVSAWVVSPKIAQDSDPWKRRIRPDVLAHFATQDTAHLKVVARTANDVLALATLLPNWGDWSPNRVWIMPEGMTADAVLATARAIAPTVTDLGWNLTLRQHVLMYGSQRGV